MAEYPLIKCKIDDPECCETCVARNQNSIYYKVVPGTKYCSRHGGVPQEQAQKRERARLYRVEMWQRRLSEFNDSDQVKSLREEVGVLRILLEETMKRCREPNDLLQFSARIQSIAVDIQKLVTACDRLERNMGEMMDKPTTIKFAGKLIEIVSEEITDVDVLDRISHRVLEEMQ